MAAFEKMQAEFEQALLTSLREKMKEREVQMQQDFERRSAEQKVLYEQREKHILERIGTASAAVKNDVSVPVGPKVDAMGIAVGDSQAPSSVSCHSVAQASVGHVARTRLAIILVSDETRTTRRVSGGRTMTCAPLS